MFGEEMLRILAGSCMNDNRRTCSMQCMVVVTTYLVGPAVHPLSCQQAAAAAELQNLDRKAAFISRFINAMRHSCIGIVSTLGDGSSAAKDSPLGLLSSRCSCPSHSRTMKQCCHAITIKRLPDHNKVRDVLGFPTLLVDLVVLKSVHTRSLAHNGPSDPPNFFSNKKTDQVSFLRFSCSKLL